MLLAGEKRKRCLAEELVGDNLVSEPVAIATPFAYTPNLKANVFQILEQNTHRYINTQQKRVGYHSTQCTISGGGLVWHHGIPEDEIWVKIGSDTGGGSFKMNFQIVNVQSPNSLQNTCGFAI